MGRENNESEIRCVFLDNIVMSSKKSINIRVAYVNCLIAQREQRDCKNESKL